MKTLVVDASAAASWLLASQSTAPARRLLAALADYELIAPDVFQWEIGNLLVRQSRRDAGFDLSQAFARLDEYEIGLAPVMSAAEVRRMAFLAQGRGLSLFDAAYLWLTLERDAGLASRDADLLNAVADAGQDVLDLREKERP